MLGELQQKKFDYLFRVLDKDGNGSLEEADFDMLFKDLIKTDETSERVKNAARRWWLSMKVFADENNDNAISKEEYAAWAEKVADAESEEFKRWADAVFGCLASGDTNITEEEYVTWFNALGLAGDAGAIFKTFSLGADEAMGRTEFQDALQQFTGMNSRAAGNHIFGNYVIFFVEDKINHYAQMIVDHGDKADELAMGQLTFYMALRRVVKGEATTQDLGMMDAVNDFLQEQGIVNKGETMLM